jgi:predicted RNA-binding protein YlxR (DUF448 family)
MARGGWLCLLLSEANKETLQRIFDLGENIQMSRRDIACYVQNNLNQLPAQFSIHSAF